MPNFQVTNFAQPEHLAVSDAPLCADREVKQLSMDEVQGRFGIEYCENITSDRRVVFSSVANESVRTATWKELEEALSRKPQRLLTVCKINDEVGYGVFARVPIKAGTIVCAYTGLLEEQLAEEGMVGKTYGMGIPDTQYRVNSEKVGGIARFLQHLPFDIESLCDSILTISDKEQLKNCMKAYSLTLSAEMYETLDDPSELEKAKMMVANRLREKYKNTPMSQEFDHKPFLRAPAVKSVLAVANLITCLVIIDGKAVMYLRALSDIPPNAQIGFTYGMGYWDRKKIVPRYFNKVTGEVLPRDVYLPSLATICQKYKTGSEMGLPDLNVSFRRAAFKGNLDDMAILLEYGADIDGVGAGTGRSALHQAARGSHQEACFYLLGKGANQNLRDSTGKSAIEYFDYLEIPQRSLSHLH